MTNLTLHSTASKSLLLMLTFVFTCLHALVFSQSFNFSSSGLKNVVLNNPTSLQFGPDGRLYVSQQNGIVKAFTITRSAVSNYSVTNTETISLINTIPNHNDDGTLATEVVTRQVTGILVTGTAGNPILYVTSSDSRIGGPSGDKNLDTNSGVISRLTRVNGVWTKLDLVRGLPRSEENHSVNGMQLDKVNNMLYLAIGGSTNAGGPSANFAYLTEYALSAAILSIDLDVIDQMPTLGSGNNAYKYDLPTVDDPTRANGSDNIDVNDPWGGNDGLNQAKIVIGGPVQVYSPGYRNVYDLVITRSPGTEGRMYTIDNGANQGWGGQPENAGPWGTVTNNYVNGEPGSTGPGISDPQVNNLDNLHYVGNIQTSAPGSHYAGHPTPIRANPAGAGLYTHDGSVGVFRTSTSGIYPLPADWPPVPVELANPIEGDYQQPGVADQALLTFSTSTNGITEYTASNFDNALKGTLLAAGYNGNIFKIFPTSDGTDVTNARQLSNKLNTEVAFASGFGSQPLDVTAQGDNDIFPGTVWAATYGSDNIVIFEPQDMGDCTRVYSTLVDDDKDGYKNADEIDNSTDPCSSSSKPNDFDLDFVSDMSDADDDNDGLADNADFFALDPANGQSTYLPVLYDLFNNDPGTGFFGLGFTGLMSNGSNYSTLFAEENLIAGGAIGAFSVVSVPAGDALGTLNSQKNGFQFGVNTQTSDGPFTVHGRILGPFFDNQTPQNFQSQGIFMGTGDQQNYLKIVLNANNGAGGIEIVYEQGGVATSFQHTLPEGVPPSTLDLFLSVNPVNGTVQGKYAEGEGAIIDVGPPITVTGTLLTALQSTPSLAVGIISTCRAATVFTATWDFIKVTANPVSIAGQWETVPPSGSAVIARHENGYVQSGDKFYLIGGRGIKAVQAFDPIDGTWTNKAATPIELHHFQAVELNGLIYVLGAFTGVYPHETPVPNVYIYNPVTDKWTVGPSIPAGRLRGSAAAVVHNGKIYLVCGIQDGHWTGHVPWLDEYDPSTNTWRVLANAPRARDHFQTQIINGKMYVAGGRRSSGITNQVFTLTVPEVDVYNMATNTWTTLPAGSNIPTMRAGTSAAVIDNELLIIGGESAQATAHNQTEALNVLTNTWRTLAILQQGRHATQAVVNNKNIYLVAGSGTQGGSGQLSSQERFYFFSPSSPQVTTLSQSSLEGPASVSFGTIPVASEKIETVTLSNTQGSQAIVISSIAISGSTGFTLTLPYPLPVVVQPHQTLTLSVKFAPATAGNHAGSLTVNHTGLGGPIAIPLTGAGSAPGLDANPTSLHFFNQEAGTTSSPQSVTLTNNTSGAIDVTSVVISGTNATAFSHNFVGPLSLAGKASMIVNVTFTPNSIGTKVAQLEVVHSGQNSPVVIGLTGEGGPNVSSIVYRINSGGPQIVTSLGTFNQDNYFSPSPGYTYTKTGEILGTTDDPLYRTERSSTSNNGNFSYAFPVSNGAYNIVLHFAEIYWTNIGKRIFDVAIEGSTVLDNYDIVKEVGPMTATTETFPVSVSDGVINILFDAASAKGGVNRPKISGIEVISLSGTNAIPVANAGADITVMLPATSTQLNGSGSDADGTIAGYSWQQNSGPNTAVFSSTTVAKPTISSLVAGSYVFSLTVQDNMGALSNPDLVTVTVSNTPPVVSAPIPDQTATVGEFFSFAFAANTFTDSNNDPLSYTSTLSDGSPLPSWLSFSPSSRTFTGTPVAEQLLTIRVIASDGKGGSATDDFFLSIDDPSSGNTALVRINAGGPSYAAGDGRLFSADQFYVGGATYTNNNIANITGTVDDVIYKSERYSMSGYAIAVQPGTYVVTLHFAEIYFGATGGGAGGAGKRVFNVLGEGAPLLTNFDIYAEVGAMAALSKTFQVQVTDGTLNINFVKVVNNPKISAIEVSSSTVVNSNPIVMNPIPDQVATAGQPFSFTFAANTFSDADGDVLTYSCLLANGSSLPAWLTFSPLSRTFSGTPPSAQILSLEVVANDGNGGRVAETFTLTVGGSSVPIATRVNAGGASYTAVDGRVFSTDNFYAGGSAYTNQNITDIAGTQDDAIYRSERFKMTAYNIPVTSGTYTLRLHFAEIFYGATGGPVGGVGKRVFNVSAEGTSLLTNFDIYAEAGPMAALVKEFVITVTDGTLNIGFTKIIENVKISAIEVIPVESVESTSSVARIAGEPEMIATEVAEEEQGPLLQAYPNPFGTTTTLEYTPPVSQQVKLQLFDVRGALVNDIYAGPVEEGNVYRYAVEAGQLVDGVYFARVTSPTNVFFVRLVLRR